MIAVFWVYIAYVLELALVTAGLVLLHAGEKQKSPLLKGAAALATFGGLLILTCTMYSAFEYRANGLFDPESTTEIVRHHYVPAGEHPDIGD